MPEWYVAVDVASWHAGTLPGLKRSMKSSRLSLSSARAKPPLACTEPSGMLPSISITFPIRSRVSPSRPLNASCTDDHASSRSIKDDCMTTTLSIMIGQLHKIVWAWSHQYIMKVSKIPHSTWQNSQQIKRPPAKSTSRNQFTFRGGQIVTASTIYRPRLWDSSIAVSHQASPAVSLKA